MPIRLMTDDDIQKGASGRVTNKDDFALDSNRYKPGGLYDPLIFGSCMRCSCGNDSTPGTVCVRCKEKVLNNRDYSLTYGYYDLTVPYIASFKIPKFKQMLLEYGIPINKGFRTLADLWSKMFRITEPSLDDLQHMKDREKEGHVYLINKYDKAIYEITVTDLINPEDEDPNYTYSTESGGLFSMINLTNYTTVDGRNFDWINQFINFKLIIPSPASRPMSKRRNSDGSIGLRFDQRNVDYRCVIAADELMEGMLNSYPKLVDQMTICWLMNLIVEKIFQTNAALASSKENLLRTEVTTRVSETIRANITSVPDLAINELLVPRSAAYEALNKVIIEELRKRNYEEKDAIKAYLEPTPEALQVFQEIVDESIVTFVRNPSLHRLSMQAFYPKLWDQLAFGIPDLVCEAYNADFDGDQMWCIFHHDPERVASLRDLLSDRLWFYEKEYRSQFTIKAETLHGLYLATRIREPEGKIQGFMDRDSLQKAFDSEKIHYNTRIIYNNQQTCYGRVRLSEILGIDFNTLVPIDKYVNKKTQAKLTAILANDPNRVEKLRQLVIFGNEVATIVGLGPLPFYDMFQKGDVKKLEEIAAKNTVPQVKQKELRDYMESVIKEELASLPDTNLEDAMASGAKLNTGQLVGLYCPAISDTGEIVVDGSRLFSGVSEMQLNSGAEHFRRMLSLKQAMVSVPGYGQRQLATLALDIKYDKNGKSPDTVGILLKEKDAFGRTRLDGSKIPMTMQDKGSDKLVRVKSCINNTSNFICGDEIAQEKFSGLNDGSSIGITFTDSIMEEMLQSGLALKHGGALYAVSFEGITSVVSGEVTSLDRDWLVINNGEYRYKISSTGHMPALNENIQVGSKIVVGQKIASSCKHQKPDYKLSCWNSLVDDAVFNDGTEDSLGVKKFVNKLDCVSLYGGVIKYNEEKHQIIIEDNTPTDPHKEVYYMNDEELYYYPEGYRIEPGTRFCSGVPDMNNIIGTFMNDAIAKAKKTGGEVVEDYGMAYAIFFYYITQSNLFGTKNSEPYELIFKLLCRKETGFSVDKANKNNDNVVNRLHYGHAKTGLSKAIQNAKMDEDTDRLTIPIQDSILLPLLLGSGAEGIS